MYCGGDGEVEDDWISEGWVGRGGRETVWVIVGWMDEGDFCHHNPSSSVYNIGNIVRDCRAF